jgi:hypothetical protein
MQGLSADSRREIVDWIVSYTTGLHGDQRDVPPSDWHAFDLEDWYGRSTVATRRRARLANLSDDDLMGEGLYLYKAQRTSAALMPRERGRPKGSGYAQADQALVPEILALMASGLSRHEATQRVAERASGGGTKNSKARRLEGRL